MYSRNFGQRTPEKDEERILVQLAATPFPPGSTAGEWGKIIRVGTATDDIQVYEPTEAGVGSAIGDCSSGHRVYFPRSITIALTAGITIPAGVGFINPNLSFSGFGGNAVTLSSGSKIDSFTITYDATGETSATGIYVYGISASLARGNARCHGATTNIGIHLKGAGIGSDRINANNIWGGAWGGTTSIAVKIEDDCRVRHVGGEAYGASTKNVGIQFAIASLNVDDVFLVGWGYATGTGSYGIEVAASGNALIIGGAAQGDTAGLIVQTGATAHLFDLYANSVTNSGTVNGIYFDGDNPQVADPIYTREQAAPGTPDSGWGAFYEKTDGKLYFKNDGGTEYDLTEAAPGSISASDLTTLWEPLTDGDTSTPELIFADGDVIMVEV